MAETVADAKADAIVRGCGRANAAVVGTIFGAFQQCENSLWTFMQDEKEPGALPQRMMLFK